MGCIRAFVGLEEEEKAAAAAAAEQTDDNDATGTDTLRFPTVCVVVIHAPRARSIIRLLEVMLVSYV